MKLVSRRLSDLDLAICWTTRNPFDVNDEDSGLFFTSRKEFERMIAEEKFLEYVSICGNYYGTPHDCLREARESDKDLCVKVDDRGVEQIKQKTPEAVSIVVVPGNSARDIKTLDSTIDPRLLSFLQELSLPSRLQGRDKYDHIIITNNHQESADRVVEIVRSERRRKGGPA